MSKRLVDIRKYDDVNLGRLLSVGQDVTFKDTYLGQEVQNLGRLYVFSLDVTNEKVRYNKNELNI